MSIRVCMTLPLPDLQVWFIFLNKLCLTVYQYEKTPKMEAGRVFISSDSWMKTTAFMSANLCLKGIYWKDYFGIVHLLSCAWLFVTPWTTACPASLSFTVSWSLLQIWGNLNNKGETYEFGARNRATL